jgi:hypothetical protein
MKLDMANYRLSVLRPQILQQSVEYERQKFKEYLSANPNGLLSTKEWLKRGHDIARSELDRVSEGTLQVDGHEGTIRVELVDICRHCYVGILLGEGGFPFPEVEKANNFFVVLVVYWLAHAPSTSVFSFRTDRAIQYK